MRRPGAPSAIAAGVLATGRFGMLTVLSLERRPLRRQPRYTEIVALCACECGTTKTVRVDALLRGLTRSCGCATGALGGAKRTKHGAINTPEYSVWRSMRQRCRSQKEVYKNYSGRGITVCARWDSFETFIADMGARPGPNYSIERVDNSRGYSPDNCVWATSLEQSNNTRRALRIAFHGRTQSLSAWAREFGTTLYEAKKRLGLVQLKGRNAA